MKIDPTPTQLVNWVAALGGAAAMLNDLVENPAQLVGGKNIPQIFFMQMKQQARVLEDLKDALIKSHNDSTE